MNIVSKFTVEKNIQYKGDEKFRNNVNFILTFLSVIIFGIFAIRPSINTISGLIKDINEYRNVNGVLIEKISILNEVKSDPDRLNQETDLISRALPENPNEGDYLRNINFIASKNEIQLESINFKVSGEEQLGTLEFDLIIHGGYPQVVKFIGDFNKLLRLTSVENIQITPQEADTQAVTAVVEGKTYFLKKLDLGKQEND